MIKYTKLTDHKDAINKTGKITDKRYMFFNQMIISKLQCGVCDKTDKVDKIRTRHLNMIHRS